MSYPTQQIRSDFKKAITLQGAGQYECLEACLDVYVDWDLEWCKLFSRLGVVDDYRLEVDNIDQLDDEYVYVSLAIDLTIIEAPYEYGVAPVHYGNIRYRLTLCRSTGGGSFERQLIHIDDELCDDTSI